MGSSLEGVELQPLLASNLKWKNKIITHKRKRLLKNHAKMQKMIQILMTFLHRISLKTIIPRDLQTWKMFAFMTLLPTMTLTV